MSDFYRPMEFIRYVVFPNTERGVLFALARDMSSSINRSRSYDEEQEDTYRIYDCLHNWAEKGFFRFEG